MTLGLHLSSLLGSVSPSMSLSLPPCLPLSFLVLARWGEGPSTQRAGVGSLRQQGVKPERARSQEPAAPGHEHTPGYTFQVLTGTHNEL